MDKNERAELLLELVHMPHWAAVLDIINTSKAGLQNALMQPSINFPDDFYIKEGKAGQLSALTKLVAEVNDIAKAENKRQS